MTTITGPWPHAGATEQLVDVDHDVPAHRPIEKGVSSGAAVTPSHAGLRFMLEVNLSDASRGGAGYPALSGGQVPMTWRRIANSPMW